MIITNKLDPIYFYPLSVRRFVSIYSHVVQAVQRVTWLGETGARRRCRCAYICDAQNVWPTTYI